MSVTARGISASLTQGGAAFARRGEESRVTCARNERDWLFCRGCLLKAERKIKTYFVFNEK